MWYCYYFSFLHSLFSGSVLTSESIGGYFLPLLFPRHFVFPSSRSWHQKPLWESNLKAEEMDRIKSQWFSSHLQATMASAQQWSVHTQGNGSVFHLTFYIKSSGTLPNFQSICHIGEFARLLIEQFPQDLLFRATYMLAIGSILAPWKATRPFVLWNVEMWILQLHYISV